MPIVKYLKADAIVQLAEEGFKTRQSVNRVVTHLNTGGTTTSIATTEVPALMGKPAATIKAATQKAKPAGSTNMVDLETGDFAIDEQGVTHLFVADPALAGGNDAPKQWHEVNMGITQAQADARYAQLGTTEFSPKFKLGSTGFGTQWAIGDPNFGAMMNGQEFIIDFDPANIATVTGWDPMATSNDISAFFVVPNIDALNVNDTPIIPLPGGGAYTLPTLRDGAAAFLLPKFRTNYKTNTFRFKKQLKAGKTEATATWDDWDYVFVKLEPKIVPVEVYEIENPSGAEIMTHISATDTLSVMAAWVNNQMDLNGGASYPGNFVIFDRKGEATVEDTGHHTGNLIKATAAGIEVWRGGSKQRGPFAWNTFKVTVTKLKGNHLTSAGGSAMLMGQLSDIYDIEQGRGVPHAADKVLNIQEIAELVKDQRDIDLDFMATFRDQISYSGVKEFTYDDMTRTQSAPGGAYNWTKSGLASFKVPVSVNANTLTYDNLISPYNRIKQEQANFTSTFLVNGMSAVYKFFTSNKALKFSGNNGQTYKWETFGKFENNARVPYIRFSGTGTMEISNNALTPAYAAQALPYEMKLADLMTNTDAGRVAIVDMEFTALPAVGTPIMDIDYVTSTLYVENRFKNFLGGLEQEILENKSIKFKEKLDEVRNHSINVQPAAPHAATVNPMPYVLKKGMTNSWGENDERFIIQVFDTENKEIYTTYYDDANPDANTYNGQPAINIRLADGSIKKYFLAVWLSSDAEGAVIDWLDTDGVTPLALPFKYEAYITMDIPTPAAHDFTNVVIAQAEIGKLFTVGPDRKIKYVETEDVTFNFDNNTNGTWKVIKP